MTLRSWYWNKLSSKLTWEMSNASPPRSEEGLTPALIAAGIKSEDIENSLKPAIVS
ncbi:MAG: hypothetical protein ACP5RH_11075 [Leptodesmis sp.]|uniref:hypothetical protein n=1 Tax=Leptodesmis sp. TaxID=3100501 RepID=UPI003D10353C